MRLCHYCKKVGPAVEIDCPTGKTKCQIISRGWRYSPPGDFIHERGEPVFMSDGSSLPGDADPAMYGGPSSGVEVIHDPVPEIMERLRADLLTPMPNGRPIVTSPDGNPKTAVGITKPPLHAIPPVALLYLGQAMQDGNNKYGLVNWRYDPITFSTYYDAFMRHALALWDGQDVDPKTKIKHLAYMMANCAILLDAEAQGTLTDDRPGKPGMTAALIERMTRKPEGERP